MFVCGAALGQSSVPAAFVANNGNLEGSVTSFTFDPNGVPVFVQKFVIGTRPNLQTPEPGANAYSISITPDGRYLATGHAASDDPFQQITILHVNADATMDLVGEYMTPDTPLDVEWISDRYLAVTRTEFGATNQVLVYAFDPNAATLTQVDAETTGTFTTTLAVRPDRSVLYAGDSNLNRIFAYTVAGDGTLTPLQTIGSPIYPLGLCITADGSKLYANGGISGGGHAIAGYHIAPDGTLFAMVGSPFTSPGASPKDCTCSSDSQILYVGHGTDSTVRSFWIDARTGQLTATGYLFDVGLQGSLGDQVIMDGRLLVTDNTTAIDGIMGLYSFDAPADGSLSMNGNIVDTQGYGPREIAVWIPPAVPCPGDTDGDLDVDLDDLTRLLQTYGLCDGDPGYDPATDLDSSGCIDLDDLTLLLQVFGAECG